MVLEITLCQTVIGHELTHGFDDEGRRYDRYTKVICFIINCANVDEYSTGNLTNWWTANVAEKFEQKAKCVSDLYSSYQVEPGLNVNGVLTLGENIADMVSSTVVVLFDDSRVT